ncbi:MAG: hypothetical protein ACOC5E_03175, partial [Acidobacteriota bacterium]
AGPGARPARRREMRALGVHWAPVVTPATGSTEEEVAVADTMGAAVEEARTAVVVVAEEAAARRSPIPAPGA